MTVVLTSITLGIIQVTGGFILKNTNWNNFEMQREILITRLCTEYTDFRILPYSLCYKKKMRSKGTDDRTSPTLIESRTII